MFLEFVFTSYIFHSLMSRTGLKKKKKKEIVIELVHHIRPPVRTQDRDKYKKKNILTFETEKIIQL